MKALSPQFQLLLDQGLVLKQRVTSGLDEGSKEAFRFELRAWSNSVISKTRDIQPHYGTEPLNIIFEYADFYVLGLRPADAANQIHQAIEIIASIPSREPTPPAEISVSMESQKLIGLCRAARLPSRKPWKRFQDRLGELKKTQALTFGKDEPIEISKLVDDFIRDIDADRESNGGQTGNFSKEYDQLRTNVDGRISSIAWLISRVAFLVPSIIIIVGAIVVAIGHPLHAGVLDIILGLSLIAFVVMELLGVLNHLAHYRSKLESILRQRLRRFFGTEDSPDETTSFLGLDQRR